ncbi:MAG: CDP-diacylglycerol--serine O-phosphatidyltransferase [Saprospiraceae bacterium]
MFSLANILTVLNLFCGCLAILQVTQNKPSWALALMGLSLVFDFLDGFVARWMKQESEIGIQLDSLADVVSFGLLPGVMMYSLMTENLSTHGLANEFSYLGFLLTCFAAFRLARFNVEADGKIKNFQGLPVPAMAIFISGIYGSYYLQTIPYSYIYHPINILLFIILLSYLMLSRISILKVVLNKQFLFTNWILIIAYVSCIVLICFSNFIFLSILIVIHIAFSQFETLFKKI